MSILDYAAAELSRKIKEGKHTAIEAMEAVFERIGEKEEEYSFFRSSCLFRSASLICQRPAQLSNQDT